MTRDLGSFDKFDPRHCEHPQTELRFRPDVNGNPRYQSQCIRCGSQVGNFVSVAAAEKLKPATAFLPFDTVLKHRMEGTASKINQIERAEGAAQWRAEYDQYLRSEAWSRRRHHVIGRANGRCEGCGERAATQVHHLTYENVTEEFLWELRAVCDICHKRAHGHDHP